jgi:CDP-2,3-bis-(O-geranylgeranyl)-sn-glycerol synthase
MLPLLQEYIIQAILFATPCWIINMSFNLINPLQKRFEIVRTYNGPIDRGIILSDGQRLLGGSQGYFSFVIIIIYTLIVSFFVYPMFFFIKGVCVFVGDALGSFIKRRLRISRGEFLVGIDHADYMLVSIPVFIGLGQIDYITGCIALILTYIFHPLVCILGYKLHIKDQKF